MAEQRAVRVRGRAQGPSVEQLALAAALLCDDAHTDEVIARAGGDPPHAGPVEVAPALRADARGDFGVCPVADPPRV